MVTKKVDISKCESKVIDSKVLVYFTYDTAGNVILETAKIPSKAELLEDLLEKLTEPPNNSNCDAFEVNPSDLTWLKNWEPNWREIMTEEFFCQVCLHLYDCNEGNKEGDYIDVSKKVQQKDKTEKGNKKKETKGRPFRILLK